MATRYGFDLADDVPPPGEPDPDYPAAVAQRMARRWISADGAAPAVDAALSEVSIMIDVGSATPIA